MVDKYQNRTFRDVGIERNKQKPRKDFSCYSEIKNHIWYMYDELFVKEKKYKWQVVSDLNEIKKIINLYINKYYSELDTKDEWFEKIKGLCDELGYASNMNDFKNNPNKYKGNIIDIIFINGHHIGHHNCHQY